jgi:hypothetical protein
MGFTRRSPTNSYGLSLPFPAGNASFSRIFYIQKKHEQELKSIQLTDWMLQKISRGKEPAKQGFAAGAGAVAVQLGSKLFGAPE